VRVYLKRWNIIIQLHRCTWAVSRCMAEVSATWKPASLSQHSTSFAIRARGDTRVALSLLWLQRTTEAQFYGYRCDTAQLARSWVARPPMTSSCLLPVCGGTESGKYTNSTVLLSAIAWWNWSTLHTHDTYTSRPIYYTKMPSIEDRGRTDRVTIFANGNPWL